MEGRESRYTLFPYPLRDQGGRTPLSDAEGSGRLQDPGPSADRRGGPRRVPPAGIPHCDDGRYRQGGGGQQRSSLPVLSDQDRDPGAGSEAVPYGGAPQMGGTDERGGYRRRDRPLPR